MFGHSSASTSGHVTLTETLEKRTLTRETLVSATSWILLQDRRVIVLVDMLGASRSTGIADRWWFRTKYNVFCIHQYESSRRCGERSLLQRHRAIRWPKSISSDGLRRGSNRSNDNDDGFGWDANRYAGEWLGSSDIRRGGTSSRGR